MSGPGRCHDRATQPAGSKTIEFPATEIAARAALGWLAACLARRGLPEDRAGDVELATAEAVNNVVEHAYAGDRPGRVRLRLDFWPGQLAVRIEDDGIALPGHCLPQTRRPDIDVPRADLPEGGFGWRLIRDLACAVEYRRDGDRNRLVLRFDLGDGG